MKTLCELFGYGRQAWYEAVKRKDRRTDDEQLLIAQIRLIRSQHHKVGAEKLYFQMKDWRVAHGINIGRDKFFNILRENGLMIHRRSKRAVTTNSRHNLRRYPNLIKGVEIARPNQVWVSDMTARLPPILPLPVASSIWVWWQMHILAKLSAGQCTNPCRPRDHF